MRSKNPAIDFLILKIPFYILLLFDNWRIINSLFSASLQASNYLPERILEKNNSVVDE